MIVRGKDDESDLVELKEEKEESVERCNVDHLL